MKAFFTSSPCPNKWTILTKTNRQTEAQRERHTERNRETDTETERDRKRHTDRGTDRQTDRQTDYANDLSLYSQLCDVGRHVVRDEGDVLSFARVAPVIRVLGGEAGPIPLLASVVVVQPRRRRQRRRGSHRYHQHDHYDKAERHWCFRFLFRCSSSLLSIGLAPFRYAPVCLTAARNDWRSTDYDVQSFFLFFSSFSLWRIYWCTVNTMTATFKNPIPLPGKLSDNNVMIVGLFKKWVFVFVFCFFNLLRLCSRTDFDDRNRKLRRRRICLSMTRTTN